MVMVYGGSCVVGHEGQWYVFLHVMHEVRLCIFYTEKGCVVVEMTVMYKKKTWLSVILLWFM